MTDLYTQEARGQSVIDVRGASVNERSLMFFSAGMNIFIKVEEEQIYQAAESYISTPCNPAILLQSVSGNI